MKTRLIAICGGSGTGKNEVVKMFKAMGIPYLVGYTTRPQRDGEVDGEDYRFADSCPEDKSHFLDYIKYGEYEYWTDERDMIEDVYTIILEETGVRHFRDMLFDKVSLFVIKVERDVEKRLQSGVPIDRIRRDEKREELSKKEYNIIVFNDKDLTYLKKQIERIIDALEIWYLKNHVYISCPISGFSIEEQRNKVDAKIEQLKRTNTKTEFISPFDVEKVERGTTYGKYLGADVCVLIDDVDEVYFMKGWENSRGCRLEHELCKIYNINRVYE